MLKLALATGRKLFIILLVTICQFAGAQTEVNTTFSDRMNYIFQPLEKARVPNGLLLDYAMEFTELSHFNGSVLTDSNHVLPSEYSSIYNTLYLSRIHTNGFTLPNPSLMDSLWFHQRDTGKIVLAGLLYNYARFRDDALQSNLISVQNDQVFDRYINGIWQNPYQTEKAFALSPSTEVYEGKSLQVVLPSNLWQTNIASEVSNISIEFEDGQGYRILIPGQLLSVNYTDTGMKVWKYRLQLTSGQYLYSHSLVKIKNTVNEVGCTGDAFGCFLRFLGEFIYDRP